MKTVFILVFAFTSFVLFCTESYSQTPAYTLSCTNRTPVANVVNSVEWNLDMTWTNSGSVPNFEYAGGQYFFNINYSLANGGVLTYANAGSSLPTNMQPRNPTVYNNGDGTAQLRLAVNTFPGPGNGYLFPAGTPVTVIRVRLQTSAAQFAAVAMNLEWRNTLPNPFTKVFAYINTINTEVTTTQTHSISFPNEPFFGGLNANFYASPRVISYGQTVNFYDSTIGSATTWNWLFPGGSPPTSNQRNPSGIRYNNPGVYPVTLIATKSGISDTAYKPNYITVNPLPCGTTWLSKLTVRDAGGFTDSLFFGMSVSGTDNIDSCLGERVVPPIPPSGAFDCRLQISSTEDSKRDIRKDTTANRSWLMKFQPSFAGYPFTFSWNPLELPSSGFFYLKDNVNGSLVNINMREVNSYQLTNSSINNLKLEYVFKTTVNVNVDPFWNLVSVPVQDENMHVTYLFPGCYLPAYGFNNGYVQVTNLTCGKGYWIQFENGGTYPISGIRSLPNTISVAQGWNLIGPFEEKIPVNKIISSPPGIVVSPYYGFSYGYVAADTLRPGKGYWVRTNTAGTLRKDTTVLLRENSYSDASESGTKIEITDNSGNSAKLYLVREAGNPAQYSLPPVPLAGIFDARFSSDQFTEVLGKLHRVKLNSASFPVKIKFLNLGESNLTIRDCVNGEILNQEIKEGAEIELPANLDNFDIIVSGAIPKSYALSQNFPNPFNPSTKINYQLPVAEKVRLTIFDILGREVKMILDSYQLPGYYEISFDANGLPSGVYLYKLEAGRFREMKKMIITK